MFDRLQPLGVCLSYGAGIELLEKYAGQYNVEVIQALKDGKRIRLVGDNVNWKVNVHDERQDHHGRMYHAFGSAIIVQNTNYIGLPCNHPQQPVEETESHLFIPSKEEYDCLKKDFAVTMLKVSAKHIPYFQKFLRYIPSYSKIWTEDKPAGLEQKNKVIPLPVLHLNEQKYDDVVQIMDFYEDLLVKCYREAGLDFSNGTVHIGGDQLTRERFSGAKRLRACGLNREERLQHLSPITFEMFHLLMNFVQMIFKQLYNEQSTAEIGTMKCEATRILRASVNPNVNEHFEADKDFIVSFVDSYIVAAVMDYFGLEDVHDVPSKNQLPEPCDSDNAKASILNAFSDIVQSYVWAKEDKSRQMQDSDVISKSNFT